MYEAAEGASLGGGRWRALPDGRTYFTPTDGELSQSLNPAHMLWDRSSWIEIAGG
ncbi:hypothetical protein [Amycolatopsis sp. cg9]|uniref:hypothetical protein n=1 Tax=Amycolatopsis sp. cg9 TaxID=3238801 RepID=UPI003525CBCF